MALNITDMVKGSKKVYFVSFRKDHLLYKTECGFEFPVPLSDVGDATFLSEDKALFFMRWIRKHIEVVNAGGASA